jgi:hypothetical protein
MSSGWALASGTGMVMSSSVTLLLRDLLVDGFANPLRDGPFAAYGLNPPPIRGGYANRDV